MMVDRFFADENFPRHVIIWLAQSGQDVLHAADLHAGWKDRELLRLAQEQDRIFLTFEGDFGELVFRHKVKAHCGVVLFRLGQLSTGTRRIVLRSFFEAAPILRGFFTVVSPGRYRRIPLSES